MGHFDHEHPHSHGEHVHEHTHTDENGQTYVHSHAHGHQGDHCHGHGGAQILAVLQYMLDHNIHHAKELGDMASELDGEARPQLLHAVESFDQANGYLSAALEELKKKE